MNLQIDTKPYDTINVTPMLDLAYVLLVVFILMTTATVQGLPMSLPKPSDKPSTERKELRIVQVAESGSVSLNGAAVSLSELASQLAAIKARHPDVTVVIRGDARARYEQVIAVVDLVQGLDITPGLVTARIGT
ncbi:MAG: hypothetical protein AMXMBFR6_10130 [Betaproteobacteria bacterium]